MDNTFPNGNPIPEWANYYAITLSPQQKSKSIIQFVPNVIKAAFKDSDNTIKYYGINEVGLTGLSFGLTYYGIAIPISSATKYNYGYDFSEGDYVEIQGYNAITPSDSFIKGFVKDYQAGNIIITPYSDTALLNIMSYCSDYVVGTDQNDPVNSTMEINNTLSSTQAPVVVTIYQGSKDIEQYEIAKFGKITLPNTVARTFGTFYDSLALSTDILGDFYAQGRTSSTGSNVCMSNYNNESIPHVIDNDLGRIAPLDNIGQQTLRDAIRYSNANVLNAQYSGYATFDALDYKQVDGSAGRITKMLPITKGVSEGGQLLILCYSNSFTTMVSKTQIMSANQDTAALEASSTVLNDINPITGGWGCQSPRTAVYFKGRAFWVDAISNVIVQFASNGAENIAEFGFNRGAIKLLSDANTDKKRMLLSGTANGQSNEYLLYIPIHPTISKAKLPTTTLDNPLDAVYEDSRVWVYNWDMNKWVGSWQSTCSTFFNFEYNVYGWANKMYEQFVGEPNKYEGVVKPSIITIPFNQGYPTIKRVMSVRFSGSEVPDETYIVAEGMNNNTSFGKLGVAEVGEYEYREGDYVSEILKDRLSNNASNNTQYNNSGFSGDRLRGKVPKVIMKWNNQQNFLIESVSIETEISSGQTKNK